MDKAAFTLIMVLVFAACQEKPEPYTQTGEASYYSGMFTGRETSSGEIYHPDSLTAAHKYLPLGTVVKVTNLDNNKSVKALINDRGPYVGERIIDLSKAAAKELGFLEDGVATVRLEIVEPAEGYAISDSLADDRTDDYARNNPSTAASD